MNSTKVEEMNLHLSVLTLVKGSFFFLGTHMAAHKPLDLQVQSIWCFLLVFIGIVLTQYTYIH